MRCIEIMKRWCTTTLEIRLIETWDVLKFQRVACNKDKIVINRNMRCIEIPVRQCSMQTVQGLIETWDVLKSEYYLGK